MKEQNTARKTLVQMPVYVHPIQAKIWRGICNHQIKNGMTLREIGAIFGEKSPQKVKHHLEQLRLMGTISFRGGAYDFITPPSKT